MNHVAWTKSIQQLLRVSGVRWIFHRIEVVEVAEELIETVHCRQKLVFIAKVVLAELAGCVAHPPEGGGDRHRLGRKADRCAGLADRRHASSDRQLAINEIGTTRGATRL